MGGGGGGGTVQVLKTQRFREEGRESGGMHPGKMLTSDILKLM